jgi:hypothetical protein
MSAAMIEPAPTDADASLLAALADTLTAQGFGVSVSWVHGDRSGPSITAERDSTLVEISCTRPTELDGRGEGLLLVAV